MPIEAPHTVSLSPTPAPNPTAEEPIGRPSSGDDSLPSPSAASTNTSETPGKAVESATSSVRIEGLAQALAEASHELHLLSHAGKYEWLNKRLILLRNAVIAFSVLLAAVVVVVMCYREAYRETLSIAPFSVPERLAERGITGQV